MGVHEAKTHLSRIIEAAERGTETVIERRGVPVAVVVPFGDRSPRFGQGGPIVVHEDFDELPAEFADVFGAER
ncbi:type II toxin-antitoxin system Phd/YefM family antitoxin [Knoellia remsis]|uniref:type II toxin-antitoxin system Phd/YefM family antitoxin n=1 Tax=Knoellia remsis TaxID=407159 RepID=UPI001C4929CE|nr:type II toxin-antitoxin system prevent-host-death family antitoxin [Knoellia remsis]